VAALDFVDPTPDPGFGVLIAPSFNSVESDEDVNPPVASSQHGAVTPAAATAGPAALVAALEGNVTPALLDKYSLLHYIQM